MSESKAKFILIFNAIIWGVSIPIVQVLMQWGFSPEFIMFARGVMLLLPCIFLFRTSIKRMSKKGWIVGLIISFISLVGGLFQSYGLEYTTASNSAFFSSTSIIIVPFIMLLIFKEKPSLSTYISLPLCILGMGFLTGVFTHMNGFNVGDIFSLICALLAAVTTVMVSKMQHIIDYKGITFTAALLRVAGPMFIMIQTPFFTPKVEFNLPLAILLLLILGIISTFVTTLAQNKAQKFVSPTTAALIGTMQSVCAAAFSIIIGNEKITLDLVLGGSCIIFGIIIMQLRIKHPYKTSSVVLSNKK